MVHISFHSDLSVSLSLVLSTAACKISNDDAFILNTMEVIVDRSNDVTIPRGTIYVYEEVTK